MLKTQAILTTLGYVLSQDRSQVLMMQRNKRPEDLQFGKYNGLGGKLARDEDIISCMRREILEEFGIVADRIVLRGTIFWPGLGEKDENWFGFIFRIESWHGEVHSGNHEGTLEWVPTDSILSLNLWPSDHNFLQMVFDDDPRLFHGCMPFKNGEMISWSYERI